MDMTALGLKPAEIKEDKGTPITTKDRAYLLEFQHKNRFKIPSGRAQQKVFWFKGNLKEAVARVREHCDIMDYKFIHCCPFIVDLEAQEKLKNSDLEGEHQDEY